MERMDSDLPGSHYGKACLKVFSLKMLTLRSV